jgi:putative dimethyl sulfoxide reductase chaperone
MFGFSLAGLDIKETGVEDLEEPEGGPDVARSKCYALLASGYNVPDEEGFGEISGGGLAEALGEQREELPYEFDFALQPVPGDWSHDDFQAEFLRLFEVGAGGPPCPLYGGLWSADRMKAMEEVVRFYNYFGLKLSDERRIPPDHLATELEFLHYLTFRQAASKLDQMAAPYRRAQLDFIARQPGGWVPKLKERLDGLETVAFFTGLVDATARFLEADHRHLTEEAGSSAPASAGR